MLEITLEGSELDETGDNLLCRHLDKVLADVICPVHGEPLKSVHLLGKWPDAMQLRFVGCCDAIQTAAKHALGLPADERTAKVSARKTDEWEIAAVGPLATSIAELFAKKSVHGRPHDPPLHVSMIRQATNASDEDLIEAIKELEALRWVIPRRVPAAEPFGYNMVVPTERLFERVDLKVMGWDTVADAKRVAAELVKGDQPGIETRVLAERLGWEPRRLNPALSYLIMNDHALPRGNVDRIFVAGYVAANARTRQFANPA